MPKSRAEMLHAIVRLIEEYSAFQRSRPDLPQGNLWGLSQDELEQLVAAFQKSQRRRKRSGNGSPVSIEWTCAGITATAHQTVCRIKYDPATARLR
jgi:hypothetical protein